jgi:hypothetical protein
MSVEGSSHSLALKLSTINAIAYNPLIRYVISSRFTDASFLVIKRAHINRFTAIQPPHVALQINKVKNISMTPSRALRSNVIMVMNTASDATSTKPING